ncbi:Ferric uptake regulation protein FUR [Paraburkholderia sabiae]|uniref:Fur family transcriptional regulator n=1 Tax=Paraburkholderia sabiae TaxID=273251 RepID=UPI001CB06DE3|nr:transcriptional repressor [Paraburkholderia sabiae]CAG9189722.1 Ferric uptake regulation protein FUR [Paraburkholderia sabiae]
MIAIYAALKTAGLRPTSSRAAVLRLFHELPHEHFTADQVYRKLSREPEPCSLASVYRALAQLHEADLITSASLGDARIVYELNRGQRHYHLVCSRCGRIQDAYDPGLEQQQARIAADHHFHYTSSSLVIFGRCENCEALPAATTRRVGAS